MLANLSLPLNMSTYLSLSIVALAGPVHLIKIEHTVC